MTAFLASCLLFGAIPLGITGDSLTASAAFDAYNVRLGDPMILTIEFAGSADFASIHPPALSKAVNQAEWRIDDASAKTETSRGQNARRLVYRVRPVKEGLLRFPALEFVYSRPDAGLTANVTVSTDPMPVHVRPGAQAALVGLDADMAAEDLPMPDGIVVAVTSRSLGDDELFRWRRACSRPTAEAFAEFDFPEARLNEAACLVVGGSWAKAIRVYSLLEWQVGQTSAIERGIVAALARKHSSAAVELPVWRSVLRPVLRFAWPGRLLCALAFFALVALVMWLCGRIVRAFASAPAPAAAAALLAFAAAGGASAQGSDPFEDMDRMMQESLQRMQAIMGASGGAGVHMLVNGQPLVQEDVKVGATVEMSKGSVTVGEDFEYVISLDAPKSATLDGMRFTASEMFGMVVTGPLKNMPDAKSPNPSNVVHRIAVPVRYDVPFTGSLSFRIEGMATMNRSSGFGGGFSSFSVARGFDVSTPSVKVSIKPLPTAGQGADFSGIIGTKLRLRQFADRNRVGTNDVVVVTHVLEYATGYVPPSAVPASAERRPKKVFWNTFFVADGTRALPASSISCYDSEKGSYVSVSDRPVALEYVSDEDDAAALDAVALDAGEANLGGRVLKLRFAPSAASPLVASVQMPSPAPEPEETSGAWSRVECGGHAGWVRTEELK